MRSWIDTPTMKVAATRERGAPFSVTASAGGRTV
jgi:hypothetical protein